MNKNLLQIAKNLNNTKKNTNNTKKKKPRNREKVCLIEKFPKKLVEFILSFSDLKTVGRFARCSTICKQIADSQLLYQFLALNLKLLEHDDLELKKQIQDWKQFCKDPEFQWSKPTEYGEYYNLAENNKVIEIKEPKKGGKKNFFFFFFFLKIFFFFK